MSKKLGNMVKEARNAKGFTQAGLAEMVEGLSASELGRIEKGEKTPEEQVLRQMAKALGVTQTSLISAAGSALKKTASSSGASASKKTASAKTTAEKKTASAKTTAEKKTASAKTTAKKTTSAKTTAAKKTASSKTAASQELKLTASEKKLVQYYRKADSDTKKTALNLLSGESSAIELIAAYLAAKTREDGSSRPSEAGGLLGALLSGKTEQSAPKDDSPLSAILDLMGKLGR